MTSNNQDKVILITGTSQGIGEGIAKHYLKQGWTVIGVNRNPEKTPKLGGNIITVKADQSSLTDFHDVVKELRTKHNITQIDIVIANSGTGGPGALLKNASSTDLDYVYQVNTRGPLVLYQATRPLLKDNGTFVVISSLAGSLQRTFAWELIGFYGASKAAVNYLTRTIHYEEPALKAFTIDPGSVDTKSAREAWDAFGKPPVEASAVDDVIPGIVKVINDSTKEDTSGWMWNP
ncbi:hypothetical protein L198_01061 [Cryptococcus wingfieldii CBS 7118]|uniref:Short-chain dehydrogenase n=1 Tax=Cryptococcus wingfieldii CBS 7118 TaxID=1295528 RepID=A0A1E3K5G1_9TREE|nr:hypothetical protein L198_01061 [Cryptococcus wingfieldii CBS 7118]ODO07482.1 hypothetical protein L198_01061 [Cryptococcus wingfieldii CBS 7118]